MHPDDLKAIWICHECKMKFLFHSDIEDHKDSTGHKQTEKVMIVMVSSAETWNNDNHNRVIDLS
jgi:ribosome biogenesis protein Nip4